MLNPQLSLGDAGGQPQLNEGMTVREVVDLPAGSKLYRFASSSAPAKPGAGAGPVRTTPSSRQRSPWWWQEKDFEAFRRVFAIDRKNPSMIARTLGGVRFDWGSHVDVVMLGVLAQPVRAFAGPGKPQFDAVPEASTGAHFTWHPAPNVDQTYIPGLHGLGTHEFNAVFSSVIECHFEALTFAQEWQLDEGALRGKRVHMDGAMPLH